MLAGNHNQRRRRSHHELAEVFVVGVQADAMELLLHAETLKVQHVVISIATLAFCWDSNVLTMLTRSLQAVCKSRHCRQENT